MDRAARLKILRILNGFSQAELASTAAVPQPSLADMERAKYAPVGDIGRRIAEELRVPFEYLYDGTFPNVPFIWCPKLPKRAQHQQAMDNDIATLLPLLLDEIKIDLCATVFLADGQVYLFGRIVNNGADIDFCGLALIKSELCGGINRFFKADSHDAHHLLTCSVSSFDETTLITLGNMEVVAYRFWGVLDAAPDLSPNVIPVFKPSNQLLAGLKSFLEGRIRNHDEITINKDQLSFIIHTALKSSNADLTDESIVRLTKLVMEQCEESILSPHKPISKQLLTDKISALLT